MMANNGDVKWTPATPAGEESRGVLYVAEPVRLCRCETVDAVWIGGFCGICGGWIPDESGYVPTAQEALDYRNQSGCMVPILVAAAPFLLAMLGLVVVNA
jgi:hypothetical protein